MDRRRLLAATAAAGVAVAAGPGRAAGGASLAGRLRAAARDAWLYTLPLVEIARVRRERYETVGLNRLVTAPRLLDPASRGVTTPNNDTLYGTAQLDLRAGPVTLRVPPARDRYMSVALMDAYSNNFAIFGTRATPDGAVIRLGGPDASQAVDVRAPTPHVWCLARTLVTGPDDVPAALALARRIELEAPSAPEAPPLPPHREAAWDVYFAGARRLLELNPPTPRDGAHLDGLADFLGPEAAGRRFDASEIAEIKVGLAEAKRIARAGFTSGRRAAGWSYAKPHAGAFGTDYNYRAAVALSGLAALSAEEAMYVQADGAGQGLFPAGRAARLHFAPGGAPPVDGFWSLSLYEATDEGQYYFAPNPLGRYAIGDRTPGLSTNRDGSLDIWIGHADPGPERRSNWLPAPAGRYALIMRAYLPKPALKEGAYLLPAVEAL